jgi:hypothetical protein
MEWLNLEGIGDKKNQFLGSASSVQMPPPSPSEISCVLTLKLSTSNGHTFHNDIDLVLHSKVHFQIADCQNIDFEIA